MRGPQLRQRNAIEYFKIIGAIHQCRLLQRLWLRAHELADKKDTKTRRQIHEYEADRAIEQADLSESQIDWDDRHLRGEHQPDEHHEENAIAARKVQPREGESS